MSFRDAFHANVPLAIAAVFGGFLGAGLLVNHHPMAGTILTMGGALWFAGWIATLPRTPALLRFWLLIVLCGGTLGFLVKQWDDEQNYQSKLAAEMPVVREVRKAAPEPGRLAELDRPSSGRQTGRQ